MAFLLEKRIQLMGEWLHLFRFYVVAILANRYLLPFHMSFRFVVINQSVVNTQKFTARIELLRVIGCILGVKQNHEG